MNNLDFDRMVLCRFVLVALLAGCGAPHALIGPTGAMPQGSSSDARTFY